MAVVTLEEAKQYLRVDSADEGGAVYPLGYGEKAKTYLRRGARPLPGVTEYPNP